MLIEKLLRRCCVGLLFCGVAAAQVQIPEGTRLRVRLEEDLSSATAQEGQAVQLSVVDEVKMGGAVVIAQGAPVAGRVVEAVPKTLTKSGKLDFSSVAVTAADGQSIPLRYSQDSKAAGGNMTSGLIGAGATVIFGPTVTMLRMMRAKDIVVPKGTVVEVFTNQSHAFQSPAPAAAASPTAATSTSSESNPAAGDSPPVPLAILSVTSTPDGAKITVDGADMGAAPASFQVDPGDHDIQIEKEGFAVWKRKLTVKAGTPIDLEVKLEPPPVAPSPAKPAAKPAAKKSPGTAPKAAPAR